MLNIILIMPKMEPEKDFHYVPLGILAIASSIENMENVHYDIFDERVDDPSCLDKLLQKAHIVGVSMFTGYQTKCGFDLLTKVKKTNPNIFTIAGGPHPTALPMQTIKSNIVDCVIAGYAESSFGEVILEFLQNGKITKLIPGVYTKPKHFELEKISFLDTPKKYKDIQWGAIPYHKINIDNYINPATKRVIYVSQYGCPAKCTFCATPETKKWVERPIELVKKDLKELYELTQFKQIAFFDATLFTRKARVKELVQFIANEFPGTSWIADARAKELKNYDVDDLIEINNETLKMDHLTVGLESGSKRIAEEIYLKGLGHLDLFLDTADKLYKANIPLTSGCIFGAPTETADDLYQTLEYVKKVRQKHKDFRLSTTFFRPLPGTDLYEFVKEFGIKFPDSFEEWGKLEGVTHYEYNKWMPVPWMDPKEEQRYIKAYQDFVEVHGEILS